MNSIIIMGRLTKDPETGSSQNGNTYARFSIAVDRRYKKDGEQDADFFNCSAFGKKAEFVEKYMKKGTKVVISGEMRMDRVTKDGKTTTYPKVMVNDIEFAESKKSESSGDDGFLNVTTEEELPFA